MLMLYTSTLWGQQIQSSSKIAEERIRVTASSATVLEWFDYIEREKQLTISYNPAAFNLKRRCRIIQSDTLTVGGLLALLLDGYKYRLADLSPRKLAIQIVRQSQYDVVGTVSEKESGERLLGAVISFTNSEGNVEYAVTDANGFFKFRLTEGMYRVGVSYMGYTPYETPLRVNKELSLSLQLEPQLFELGEVTVKSYRTSGELNEVSPSRLLSFNGSDLFSQIWILPGVSGIPAGNNFLVDGGNSDENLLLLDGVPVYHPGHINRLLPVFNGDALKNVVFHKGFFPTRFEGRLSSVTEANLKSGNKQEHICTLTLDMPAASAVLEGPLVKNHLSYVIGGRRSWLDFFDNLLSEDERLNHSFYDFNAKLSWQISQQTSVETMAYWATDEYHLPSEEEGTHTVLKWNNQIYQLRFNTQTGYLGNISSISFTSHSNRARADELVFDSQGYLKSGVRSADVGTEFTYSPDNVYSARCGVKCSYEIYDMVTFGYASHNHSEPIFHCSLFYDNHIRISDDFSAQIGVHWVGYAPKNYRSYHSIQPRISFKYSPTSTDLFYVNFSKMEQFYHCLLFDNLELPTDFRMPSIEGFKPRSSSHYETGWKHFMEKGQVEISAYYKTRHNIVAMRPECRLTDEEGWASYIMTGDGDSYGLKFYFYYDWRRWMLQSSYTYSRSREWFDDVRRRSKLPSLYDIPHQLGCAVSYKLSTRSALSAGGVLRSGKVVDYSEDDFDFSEENFRTNRCPLNYRVDAGYSYQKDFGESLFLVKVGLYNIIGNPPVEDIIDFYSVRLNRHCLPYGSISVKF